MRERAKERERERVRERERERERKKVCVSARERIVRLGWREKERRTLGVRAYVFV